MSFNSAPWTEVTLSPQVLTTLEFRGRAGRVILKACLGDTP